MTIIDTNVILRYLLNDHNELSSKATIMIETNEVLLPNEVIAEVVYVLQKVYLINNQEISHTLLALISFENIKVEDFDLLKEAFRLFSIRKFDFVDTILYAHHKVRGHDIMTFDKKVNYPPLKR
jgi:predicted nucleic-acid-binding protein